MKDFISALLGGQPAPLFFVNCFFALIGVVLTLLLSTTFRDIDSKRTPEPFSWRFFWRDNAKRIAAGIILIYLALRFTPEIFGVNISNIFAVFIGIINDSLAYIIRDRVRDFKTKFQKP